MTPTIRTDRLFLRPIASGDQTAIQTHCADIDVARWMIHMPHPYTAADADEFVAKTATKPGSVWGVTYQDALIGMVGTVAQFGYWFGKPFWGQGFATEAGRAVLAQVFATTDQDQITASHMVANSASAHLLRKLGFVDDGPMMMTSKATGLSQAGRAVLLTRAGWEVPRA